MTRRSTLIAALPLAVAGFALVAPEASAHSWDPAPGCTQASSEEGSGWPGYADQPTPGTACPQPWPDEGVGWPGYAD
jgi:hypothetical protein